MEFLRHPSTYSLLIHAILVIGISVRVIMKRPAPGVAMAWLFLVAIFPYGGAIIYLLIGERRIGRRRANGFNDCERIMPRSPMPRSMKASPTLTGLNIRRLRMA